MDDADDCSTVEGTVAAFKEIMRRLPDELPTVAELNARVIDRTDREAVEQLQRDAAAVARAAAERLTHE